MTVECLKVFLNIEHFIRHRKCLEVLFLKVIKKHEETIANMWPAYKVIPIPHVSEVVGVSSSRSDEQNSNLAPTTKRHLRRRVR